MGLNLPKTRAILPECDRYGCPVWRIVCAPCVGHSRSYVGRRPNEGPGQSLPGLSRIAGRWVALSLNGRAMQAERKR